MNRETIKNFLSCRDYNCGALDSEVDDLPMSLHASIGRTMVCACKCSLQRTSRRIHQAFLFHFCRNCVCFKLSEKWWTGTLTLQVSHFTYTTTTCNINELWENWFFAGPNKKKRKKQAKCFWPEDYQLDFWKFIKQNNGPIFN